MVEQLSIETLKEIDNEAEKVHYAIFGESTDYENLEEYLEYQGIDIRYISSQDVDGYLRWDYNKNMPVIAVSITDNALVRQRFTMAHELGHLVLDLKWSPGSNQYIAQKIQEEKNNEFLNVLSYRGKVYTLEEKKVDEFAGAFLIPKEKLKKLILEFYKKHTDDFKNVTDQLITEISQTFKVSSATASLRVKNYARQLKSDQENRYR